MRGGGRGRFVPFLWKKKNLADIFFFTNVSFWSIDRFWIHLINIKATLWSPILIVSDRNIRHKFSPNSPSLKKKKKTFPFLPPSRLTRAMEGVQEAVLLVDVSSDTWSVAFANHRAMDLLGLEKNAVEGASLWKIARDVRGRGAEAYRGAVGDRVAFSM